MKSEEWCAFWFGAVTSMILLGLAMHFSGNLPKRIEKKYQQEAIRLGYATNIIIFQNEEFKVQFNWITNK